VQVAQVGRGRAMERPVRPGKARETGEWLG
jgi:hypothetical protein